MFKFDIRCSLIDTSITLYSMILVMILNVTLYDLNTCYLSWSPSAQILHDWMNEFKKNWPSMKWVKTVSKMFSPAQFKFQNVIWGLHHNTDPTSGLKFTLAYQNLQYPHPSQCDICNYLFIYNYFAAIWK